MTGGSELRHAFVNELQYYRDRAAGMLSVLGTGERNAIALVRQFHLDFAEASEADIKDAEHESTPAGWAAFFKNEAIIQMIERD
jgi:hypothetical protein